MGPRSGDEPKGFSPSTRIVTARRSSPPVRRARGLAPWADGGNTVGVTERKSDIPEADLLGVRYSLVDYQQATEAILSAATANRSFGVSALAVHGLMEANQDPQLRAQINSLDLVTADGQPIRWALNGLRDAGLADRVYGPTLTWHVLEAAESAGVGVYLFGSTSEVAEGFASTIRKRHPTLNIAGIQPDRFRDATPEEDEADVARIVESGAGIVLVGRGCPRQERWVADHLERVPAAMLAVGAAFDYGAGAKKEPPQMIQRAGLQWAWRLAEEPDRLWRRYLHTNSRFLLAMAREWRAASTVTGQR